MQTARLTILMEPSAKEALERRAAELGVSASELVRRAVDSYDPTVDPDALRSLADELDQAMVRVGHMLDATENAVDMAGRLAKIKAEEGDRVRCAARKGDRSAQWPFDPAA